MAVRLAAFLIALGACGAPAASEAEPLVVVIGDSITHRSIPDITAALSGYDVRITAQPGEGFGGGGLSDQANGWWAVDRAEEWRWFDPAVVVLALGTNDLWRPGTISWDETVAGLERMVDAFPRSCVVAVGVRPELAGNGGAEASTIAELNGLLTSAADVFVAPEFEADDGIHPRWPDGVVSFGETVGDGVRACP